MQPQPETEPRGLALEWDKDVYEALVCLELIANGGDWHRWQQRYTDTRGIVTERAGRAILKALNQQETPAHD